MLIRLPYKVVNAIKNDPPYCEWKEFARGRQMVNAIKALRSNFKGLGLKEAKDAVVLYMNGGNLNDVEIYDAPPPPPDTEIFDVPGGQMYIINDINGYRAEYRHTIGHNKTRHGIMQDVLNWVAQL